MVSFVGYGERRPLRAGTADPQPVPADPPPPSPHLESAQPLRRLLVNLDVLDARARRPCLEEPEHSVDRVARTFQNRFHGAV